MLADVAETVHLHYINQVAKDSHKSLSTFHATASDLMIDQAEEKFLLGRKYFHEGDFDRARVEFDGSIDLMLKASDTPTDRALYECKMEDMVDSIHRFDLSGMGAAVIEAGAQYDKAPLDDIVQMTFPVDPRIKDKVQTEIKTTSSALPLVVNDVVLGYINYFNSRGRRTIEAGLSRAGRYRPMISKILAEEGVPQELIYLAQAESGFLPRAVSRAAAEGMWQFVKFRGNQYGLMQTAYSDDRLDPEKATRAAAHHLHDLYNEFGDWYLAIAAYNCGPGAVERAVERTGYADYWELRARHALPTETTNYVPIILAMTIMSKNAAAYGFDQITPDVAIEYDTIQLPSPTNLALIGDLADTPPAELQQLNPALLRGVAPGSFDLRVPKGSGLPITAALSLVPAEIRAASRMHRVEAGENIQSIARRFNSSSRAIAAANNLNDSEPTAGDKLFIPTAFHDATVSRTHGAPVRTASSSRKAGATTVAAKRPLHRTAGTIAQVSRRSHVLNQ
ncbi:MAG: transglycosylase SLT domain-containing protein [Acidobacteriota bacterium]|nr:transglycosylase SLT domain-containing protein [Acidobacteriota bacterium]